MDDFADFTKVSQLGLASLQVLTDHMLVTFLVVLHDLVRVAKYSTLEIYVSCHCTESESKRTSLSHNRQIPPIFPYANMSSSKHP